MSYKPTKTHKAGLYMDDALYNQVKNIYRKDGSRSMTDFMEKAIRFYIGYLETNDGIKKIAPELVATYKEANMEALNRLSAPCSRMRSRPPS